jgi:hypothetical protein
VLPCIAVVYWPALFFGSTLGPPGITVIDLKILRRLRERISAEENPATIRALSDLLGSMIRENDAEVTLRLRFVRKKFAALCAHSKEAVDGRNKD